MPRPQSPTLPLQSTSGPTRVKCLPRQFFIACRRHAIRLQMDVLWVIVSRQEMFHFRRRTPLSPYARGHRFLISTSRFGTGQEADSNRTPLGLHRIRTKVGRGWPSGTIFEGRKPIGLTWDGSPDGSIVHRVMWLEGLEDRYNRGGRVDSYARFIYIHGYGDEHSLGRPRSRGCIHLAGKDLIRLFDLLPEGTLVWIAES